MKPCCIRVSKFGEHWSAATAVGRRQTIDLVELVIQSPEFIGMVEPNGPMPRAAVVVPQPVSGQVLVVVDERGGVQLVGCPDMRQEGSAAKVISDILAANGRLWHQKYPAFAALFDEALGMALADWVSSRVGPGFSAAAFRSGVEDCLNKGRFPIVLLIPEFDSAAREMLSYLRNMNLEVRPLGFELYRGDGVEVVRPKLFPEDRPKLEAAAHKPEPAPQPEPKPAPARPEPPRRETEVPVHRKEYAGMAGFGATQKRESAGVTREPFPVSDASPKQQEILVKLLGLDDIGLIRRGFEYFPPDAQGKAAAEGTIVVAIDPDRWPFPSKDEVIVVVNTGPEFLAGYLKIPPREVEEFLGSLPRAERKEHKGCLLLRANTTYEATQLVNELKALKAVSTGGIT
ncbi:MAG: hypothetical protein ABIK37_07360 [candidate division WOR-3 bacterium]